MLALPVFSAERIIALHCAEHLDSTDASLMQQTSWISKYWSKWVDGKLQPPEFMPYDLVDEQVRSICQTVNQVAAIACDTAVTALSHNIKEFEQVRNACAFYVGVPDDIQELLRNASPAMDHTQFAGVEVVGAGPFKDGVVYSNASTGVFSVFPRRRGA